MLLKETNSSSQRCVSSSVRSSFFPIFGPSCNNKEYVLIQNHYQIYNLLPQIFVIFALLLILIMARQRKIIIQLLFHSFNNYYSLADSLVCSNGIISPKMAGKLRFLDSTYEIIS